jgi:NADH-quinone oxidoreductase subunit J
MTALGEWTGAPEFVPAAIASFVAVLGALLMVTRRDVVRGALWLVVTFVALAVLYVTLGAELLAMAQIAVYAGAIMVLFLFVIILFAGGREPAAIRRVGSEARLAGAAVAGLLLVLVYCIVLDVPSERSDARAVAGIRATSVTRTAPMPVRTAPPGARQVPLDHPQQIGEAMFSARNVLTLELIAVLLIVAMVGVVVLAKGRVDPALELPVGEEGDAQ